MRRLSAPSTHSYKRMFPIFWFGELAIFVMIIGATVVDPNAWMSTGQLASFLLPMAFAGVGSFFIFKMLIADLIDEVWLDGDCLVVKNRDQQIRVGLGDVMNVNATTMTNPRRVTLMLRTDSRFGRNLTFMPASPRGFLSAFKPDPIATELIGRVDALRTPAP
jgi:hypothetical protein